MLQRVHTIAMFPKLQPDTLTALYILKTFGEPAFPGIRQAQLKFWTKIPDNQDPKKLEQEGFLLIDLGGMFDHHDTNQELGTKSECLSTLIAKYLKVDSFPSLKKILAWAKRDDLEGKGTISTDTLDRAFGLPGIIMNLNRLPQYSPVQIVNMILPLIDAHVKEEYRRFIEFPKLWKTLLDNKKAFTFYLGNEQKVAVLETDEVAMAGFLRNREDIKLVITKGSKGHINIITKQDAGLDLVPLISKIRTKEAILNNSTVFDQDLAKPGRVEGAPEWYFDTAANTLQNGGAFPEGIKPTSISLGDIVTLVKEVYGTVTKGNLWIKLDDNSKDQLRNLTPPKFEVEFIDHITLKFGVNLDSIPKEFIGSNVTFNCVAERWNKQIQAVQVELPTEISEYTTHPHITISARRGVPPVKSNEMLDSTENEMSVLPNKVLLSGQIEFFEFNK